MTLPGIQRQYGVCGHRLRDRECHIDITGRAVVSMLEIPYCRECERNITEREVGAAYRAAAGGGRAGWRGHEDDANAWHDAETGSHCSGPETQADLERALAARRPRAVMRSPTSIADRSHIMACARSHLITAETMDHSRPYAGPRDFKDLADDRVGHTSRDVPAFNETRAVYADADVDANERTPNVAAAHQLDACPECGNTAYPDVLNPDCPLCDGSDEGVDDSVAEAAE